jgi:pimeloyl-ACP methyl ester carboxylesterase
MGKFLLFKDKKIHYTLQGKGRVVVLLHGFMESMEIWKNLARKLSSEFTVVCIDLPGHGRSDSLQPVHSMELMADAVNAVLKELGATSCLMAGHSMGGYVTLAFAERHPRKIKGFSLFHSHAAADTPEAQQNRDRTIKVIEKDKKGFIQSFIPDLFDPQNVSRYKQEIHLLTLSAASMPEEAIIAVLEGMKVRIDRIHVLANTSVPVQFIIGKNDSRIPMQVIMPQTVLPGQAEITIVDNVGHMGFIEASKETYLAISCFARKVFS